MYRSESLIESRPSVVQLNELQLSQLKQLSRELAGRAVFWGDDVDENASHKEVIRIEFLGGIEYRVTFLDVVGAVGLSEMSMIVRPKIPKEHFAHIAKAAFASSARLASPRLSLASGFEFHELLASWFLDELDALLARRLRRNYVNVRDRGATVKGRLQLVPTVNAWLKGDPVAEFEFDDFSLDNPPNRILKAAAVVIAQNPALAPEVRSRAAKYLRHMGTVGQYKRTDAKFRISREFHSYTQAFSLALDILNGLGRELNPGQSKAKSFLLKTPPLIEDGIRNILERGLRPLHVRKRGMALVAEVTVNPDLLLGPPPFTGDVKYKLAKSPWNRPDLAQAVFFAAAFRSPRALIIGFDQGQYRNSPKLDVGDIEVQGTFWDCSPNSTPEASEHALVASVSEFISDELVSVSGYRP
jgi:5-methylcytosine-specific restriction enzyme subunit McrC